MLINSISYRSSQINYCWFGTGKKLLLCLHGYGESQETFQFLENHLPADYSALAIDFPFHGQTNWNEGPSFTINDLVAIINDIRVQHTAASARLTIIGF